MAQKFEWLSQLDRMENPMMNLIDVMKNAVSGIANTEEEGGIAKYIDVYDLLKKAEDNIHEAVRLATNITYGLKR